MHGLTCAKCHNDWMVCDWIIPKYNLYWMELNFFLVDLAPGEPMAGVPQGTSLGPVHPRALSLHWLNLKFSFEKMHWNVFCIMLIILFRPQCVNPSGAEVRIFQVKLIWWRVCRCPGSFVAASAAAAMVLTALNIHVLLFHEERFQYTGLILGLHPANERCRYKVTPSLIGWAQT